MCLCSPQMYPTGLCRWDVLTHWRPQHMLFWLWLKSRWAYPIFCICVSHQWSHTARDIYRWRHDVFLGQGNYVIRNIIYASEPRTLKSQNSVSTSLLCLKKAFKEARPVVRWFNKQHRESGGYGSTQVSQSSQCLSLLVGYGSKL